MSNEVSCIIIKQVENKPTLFRYLENTVGCTVPLLNSNTSLRTCAGRRQLEALFAENEMLALAEDQRALVRQTGCVAPCQRAEYKLKFRGNYVHLMRARNRFKLIRAFLDSEKNSYATNEVGFFFGNSRYMERREYLVYDSDSFIADTGGAYIAATRKIRNHDRDFPSRLFGSPTRTEFDKHLP